jgi:predicted dehydrogenase
MGVASSRIGTLVVGYGYWGPNLVRNVVERPELRLMGLCELDESRIADFRRRHPAVWVDRELETALSDPRVEAVVIATPPSTHHPLVWRALEAGKHVLVEKPLATSSAQAVELVELAEREGLVLMPGHTFVYSPAVDKVRELIQEDVLGEVYFATSSRMNLGKYQPDGVVLDLAPHDLSILMHWLGERVVSVTATGRSVFQADVHETAFLTLTFAGGAQANVQLSWLAPRKVRQMVVVGSRRMVQYDDSAADESVRIYDRGLDFDEPPSNFGEYRLTYRTGDMVAPRIEAAEPLGLELKDFAAAVREGSEPRSSTALGLDIVLTLEALEQSLRRGGQPVRVGSATAVPLNGKGQGNGVARVALGSGHHNGNGNGNGNASERRLIERRIAERRIGERRVAALGQPLGGERRLADRRRADRRIQDRRDLALSIGYEPLAGGVARSSD